MADFKQVYLLPELNRRLEKVSEELESTGHVLETAGELKLLQNEISKFNVLVPGRNFKEVSRLNPAEISPEYLDRLKLHLGILDDFYAGMFSIANTERENLILYYMGEKPGLYNRYKDEYHNESVEDHVRKVYEKNKMVEYRHQLIQQIDPIYLDPFPSGRLSFRSHFFAPRKYFAGRYIDTYWFNIGFIWLLSILFYILLYFNVLYKGIHLHPTFKFRS